ncbi:MAG: 1-phosphofructokinase family hexose kinase, partial [Brevefilum sp.]
IPPDVPETFYADLIQLLKSRGARVILDASGGPLRLGCQEAPFLVKINVPEASELVGFEIDDPEDAKRAALPFLRMGVTVFGLTMGKAGLLLATQKEMVYASAPRIHVRNAAGSGDSLLAGLIYAQQQGLDLVETARWGVATGSASVETDAVSEFEIQRIQELLDQIDSKIINVM